MWKLFLRDKMSWPFCQPGVKQPHLPSNFSSKTLFKHESECVGSFAAQQHGHLKESDAEQMTDNHFR